jgi:HMG (high mobility group) box
MIYSQENRDRIKQENPDAKMGEIAKLLGDAYKKLGSEEKAELDKKVSYFNLGFQSVLFKPLRLTRRVDYDLSSCRVKHR